MGVAFMFCMTTILEPGESTNIARKAALVVKRMMSNIRPLSQKGPANVVFSAAILRRYSSHQALDILSGEVEIPTECIIATNSALAIDDAPIITNLIDSLRGKGKVK
jgi:phospholipid N-methyltransferase